MGYDQYTVPDAVAVEPDFSYFPLALANIQPWPLVSFIQFSEKQLTQNHSQYLSGLSRSLFSTTFLEIAVPPRRFIEGLLDFRCSK